MKRREYKLANSKKISLQQDPRYGFWTFKGPLGPPPKNLEGTWTRFDDLFKAVEQHYQTKNNPIIEQI